MIKIELDCIYLPQNRDKWRDLVDTVLIFLVS
jgi:hypothetical protein